MQAPAFEKGGSDLTVLVYTTSSAAGQQQRSTLFRQQQQPTLSGDLRVLRGHRDRAGMRDSAEEG